MELHTAGQILKVTLGELAAVSPRVPTGVSSGAATTGGCCEEEVRGRGSGEENNT